MNTPAVFSFDQSFSIRVIDQNGEPWFVAADVCAALGIANSRDALLKLDDDEKGVGSTDTLGGVQEIAIINESGLYTLILRCRDATKPGTLPHRFRKWVTAEVLPAIRKTGRYQAPAAPEPAPSPQITAADETNIRRIVWLITGRMHHEKTWVFAVWSALRQVTGCPSPHRFQECHLPAIAAELRRILEATEAFLTHVTTLERELCRRVLRGQEPAAPFIAEFQAQEVDWLNELRPWVGKIDAWDDRAFDALANRTAPDTRWDDRAYADPAQLAAPAAGGAA